MRTNLTYADDYDAILKLLLALVDRLGAKTTSGPTQQPSNLWRRCILGGRITF